MMLARPPVRPYLLSILPDLQEDFKGWMRTWEVYWKDREAGSRLATAIRRGK